jgi:hypothetical protein
MQAILREAGLGTAPRVNAEMRQKLRQRINSDVENRNRLRLFTFKLLPSTQEKKLQVLQTKLQAARAALIEVARGVLDREIACAADWLKSREEEGRDGPIVFDEYLAFLAGRPSDWMPSISSLETLPSAHAHIARLETCAKIAEVCCSQRKKIREGKKQDRLRRIFVRALADRYEEVFGPDATEVKDGEWPKFLAAMLSHLERKAVSTHRASALWRSAKTIKTYVSSSVRFELRK